MKKNYFKYLKLKIKQKLGLLPKLSDAMEKGINLSHPLKYKLYQEPQGCNIVPSACALGAVGLGIGLKGNEIYKFIYNFYPVLSKENPFYDVYCDSDGQQYEKDFVLYNAIINMNDSDGLSRSEIIQKLRSVGL